MEPRLPRGVGGGPTGRTAPRQAAPSTVFPVSQLWANWPTMALMKRPCSLTKAPTQLPSLETAGTSCVAVIFRGGLQPAGELGMQMPSCAKPELLCIGKLRARNPVGDQTNSQDIRIGKTLEINNFPLLSRWGN